MNHVTVLCFKTLFPKEADGRDWQQLLKTFISLCMYSKERGLPNTQNRKGKTFPYCEVIMANFIKYHLFSSLVEQKTGEERKIIMKGLHMLLEALAICQYKHFPIRLFTAVYQILFYKNPGSSTMSRSQNRNTQKYIAGIMGLGLVSFCRWNQLTSTCFAHVCRRLRVLHLQPTEQSSKSLWILPFAWIWLYKRRCQHLHSSKSSGLFKLVCRAKLQSCTLSWLIKSLGKLVLSVSHSLQ